MNEPKFRLEFLATKYDGKYKDDCPYRVAYDCGDRLPFRAKVTLGGIILGSRHGGANYEFQKMAHDFSPETIIESGLNIINRQPCIFSFGYEYSIPLSIQPWSKTASNISLYKPGLKEHFCGFQPDKVMPVVERTALIASEFFKFYRDMVKDMLSYNDSTGTKMGKYFKSLLDEVEANPSLQVLLK